MTVTADYVLQGVNPQQIATAPFDVQVVETTDDDGVPFTAAQVAQMESGGSQVLGYFSLGEAENFRDYFSSLPASVVGPQDPDWPGDYQVAFWTPQWKAVAEQAIDQMVSAGYNGIYFDVVDEYQQAWAQSHDPNAAQDMVNLVESLKQYATAKDPNFQVWVNSSGAEDLLSHPDYVNAINGTFEEELFYKDNGSKQSAADVQYNLQYLDKATAAGKPVVAIEYVSGATKIADVHTQAAQDGIGSYVGHLDLDGIDTDGVLPGQTVQPVGTSTPPGTGTGTGTGSGAGSGTGSGSGSTGTGSGSGSGTGTGSGTSTGGSPPDPTGGHHHTPGQSTGGSDGGFQHTHDSHQHYGHLWG
jgi:cysteinyl-tRNA synthetase